MLCSPLREQPTTKATQYKVVEISAWQALNAALQALTANNRPPRPAQQVQVQAKSVAAPAKQTKARKAPEAANADLALLRGDSIQHLFLSKPGICSLASYLHEQSCLLCCQQCRVASQPAAMMPSPTGALSLCIRPLAMQSTIHCVPLCALPPACRSALVCGVPATLCSVIVDSTHWLVALPAACRSALAPGALAGPGWYQLCAVHGARNSRHPRPADCRI